MNDDMVGAKNQRQQICYCSKKSVIQLGLRGLPGLNIAFEVGTIFFLLYVLFSTESLKAKASFIGILAIFIFSFPIYEYFSTKRKMVKANHSEACSRRIAFQGSLYLGRFSRFAILNPEEEKTLKKKIGLKTIDTQMDYGPVAGGLGIVTFITNLTFFMQLDGGNTSAIIYPILFILIIAASTIILIQIKGRKMVALALSLSNVCFTSAFFMLYILIIAFSLMK